MTSFLTQILLCVILLFMFSAQTLRESNDAINKTFDIYNFTETHLAFNESKFIIQKESNIPDHRLDYGEIQFKRIQIIIEKTTVWFGTVFYEIAKWSFEFGYTHPEYDFGFILRIIIYILIASVITAFFPLVVPLLALIYILFKWLKEKYIQLYNKIKVKR